MSTASARDVGVVIVTHNRADSALACAEAISPEVDPACVVVVVNDPEAAGPDDLARLQERVGRVVLNTRRAGYGANLNEGVRHVDDGVDCLLLLNDDAFAQKGAIHELRSVLDGRPEVGLVGPQFVDDRGRLQPSRHRFPSLGSELIGALLLPAALERLLSRRFADPAAAHVAADDIWLVGAALLVRASAFRAIDGFDERFFLYSEELDLAYRLRQHGWISCFCDGAVVQHVGGQSTRGSFERMLGESRWRYVRAHWSLGARVSLVALLPAVYLWNSFYVAVRVLANPRSFRDKLEWWQSRWGKRPLPGLRAGHRAMESA